MDFLLAEPEYFLIVLLMSSRSVVTRLLSKLIMVIYILSLSLDQCSPGLTHFFDLLKETIFGILSFLNCLFSVSFISTLTFVFFPFSIYSWFTELLLAEV